MKSIWLKITGLLAGGLAIALAVIKHLAGKNRKLEHEIKIKSREEGIEEAMEEATGTILKTEKERIEKADRTGYSADDLNKL